MPKNKVSDPDLSRLSRGAEERAVEGLRRRSLDREQVLDRLWEIANLGPEMTRGSITGQVKALEMIVAMQDLIPNRRAVSAETKSAPAPSPHTAAWLARHPAKTINPGPAPPPVPHVPLFTSVPDLGVDFHAKKTPLNPFVRPR